MFLSELIPGRSPIARTISFIIISLAIFAGYAAGQAVNPGSRNNPYSPSPSSKMLPASTVSESPVNGDPSDSQIAMVPRSFGKPVESASHGPSEIYRVGVGDVLFIKLKNSDQGSGYFTVRADGTIDYPLAGDNVIAADNAVDTIETILESGIKLFQDPGVSVSVREYGSHKITVTGMVENAGERSLQREAIPLFVVRAEAIVNTKATRAIITRGPLAKVESYDLHDADTDNVLIYPGNAVEFADERGPRNTTDGYFFIGGEVNSTGQKLLSTGLTLYQAVVASGGSKGNPKKAIIRRKNARGLFDVLEHNLKAIRDGKAADPALSSGDIVEIRN